MERLSNNSVMCVASLALVHPSSNVKMFAANLYFWRLLMRLKTTTSSLTSSFLKWFTYTSWGTIWRCMSSVHLNWTSSLCSFLKWRLIIRYRLIKSKYLQNRRTRDARNYSKNSSLQQDRMCPTRSIWTHISIPRKKAYKMSTIHLKMEHKA